MNIDSELDKLTRIPWEKLTDEQKCSYALLAELYPERARLACDREIDELVAIPFEELTQDHCDRFFDIILIRNDIPDSILRRFEVRAAQLGGREVWGDIADPQSFFGARAWFEIRRVIAQQQASDDLYLPTLGKLIRAAREKECLTQEDLADRLEIRDRVTVAKWEGDKAIPHPRNLKLISDKLSIPLQDLLAAAKYCRKKKDTQKTHKSYRLATRKFLTVYACRS